MDRQSIEESLWKKLLSEEVLQPADLTLAESFLSLYGQDSDSLKALFCYLLLALRQGHLCVRIEEEKLFPSLQEMPLDLPTKDSNILKGFHDLIIEGINTLPQEMVSEGSNRSSGSLKPLVRWNTSYYFQKHWVDETAILKHLNRLMNGKEIGGEEEQKMARHLLEEMEGGGRITKEQAKAIATALESRVSLICGGPGTGKTYTAALLVEVLGNSLKGDARGSYEIVLAAPTGKAASRLKMNFLKIFDRLEGVKPPVTTTLHRLLNIQPNRSRRSLSNQPLAADLVIIDESSMVDVHLMARLFKRLKDSCRLVLLGDPDQLPSIEAGAVFLDLCKIFKNLGKGFVELKKCLRTDVEEMVTFFGKIREGAPDFMAFINTSSTSPVRHLNIEKPLQKGVVDYCFPFFPADREDKLKTGVLVDSFRQFCVLSPLKKGPLGVEELNKLFLKKKLSTALSHEPFSVPIMITKNDPKQELFNGDLGVLVIENQGVSFPLSPKEKDYALFLSEDQTLRKIPAFLLPSFDLAFCLSVHKSQGSEFDHVVVIIPEEADRFHREMFYTAATRARQRLEVVGEEEVLRKMVGHTSKRYSSLAERFGDLK